jgi:hypothetical protein
VAAAPARRPVDWAREPPGPRATRDRAARNERIRRERHLRRRRRDLLVDTAVALVVTVLTLSLTAGLGVVALLQIPVAGAIAGSFLLERSLRKRRASPPPRRESGRDLSARRR